MDADQVREFAFGWGQTCMLLPPGMSITLTCECDGQIEADPQKIEIEIDP